MIFYAWDYLSGPIFRRRSQCDVKTPSDSVIEAAIHRQRNAIQLVRNPISLLLNHSHGFEAFRNGLLVTPNDPANSSCVWHEFSANNNSRHVSGFSLKAASP